MDRFLKKASYVVTILGLILLTGISITQTPQQITINQLQDQEYNKAVQLQAEVTQSKTQAQATQITLKDNTGTTKVFLNKKTFLQPNKIYTIKAKKTKYKERDQLHILKISA